MKHNKPKLEDLIDQISGTNPYEEQLPDTQGKENIEMEGE
ncbi:hypothetical protein ANABIO32_00850 [Rossellomorea marisflavi]|nr:hypothetical protein ANABIO32_00850 [Rossellomorea marisflavi]